MIRAIRWLWLVLPRGWIVALFFLFYLVLEGLWLWMSMDPNTKEVMEQFRLQRNRIMIMVAAAYGLFRVVAFHPLFRQEYCKWLELTPWDSRKPLPMGPIHWVLQDAVVIGLLMVLMYPWDAELLYVPVAFAIAYQAALASSLWPTGLQWRCYAILLILGLAIRLIQFPAAALAIAVILYPFSYRSLIRSLERFPWQLPEWWPRLELKPNATREDRKPGQKVLGWPYDLLQPINPRPGISRSDGAAVSALLGWWFYAVVANVPAEGQIVLWIYSTMPIGWAALWRVGQYCTNYWWPISLWGRLRTGRWIIPRYDRVFVAPVLALAIQLLAMHCVTAFRLNVAVGTAIALALAMAALSTLGPTLTEWPLTGGHRIVPRFANKREFVQL